MNDLEEYTVVGAWEDQQSFVEHVEAVDVAHAIVRAFDYGEWPEREGAWPVAVFEGHLPDLAADLGREEAEA